MTKVFVHGNPETVAVWGPLIAELSARGQHDVVALSPPGFGAPTPDGWAGTPQAYIDWLATEIEALGAPADLIGHDWGAGHVLGLVADRPDLVNTWAADCGGLVHPDYEWHDMAQAWQSDDGEVIIDMMTAGTVEDRTTQFAELGLPTEIAASIAHAVNADMGRCILSLYRAAAQPYLANLGDRLAAAEGRPGMVINALDDAYVPADLSAGTAERLGAHQVPLEGRGHWWMVDDVAPIADALISFWEEHS